MFCVRTTEWMTLRSRSALRRLQLQQGYVESGLQYCTQTHKHKHKCVHCAIWKASPPSKKTKQVWDLDDTETWSSLSTAKPMISSEPPGSTKRHTIHKQATTRNKQQERTSKRNSHTTTCISLPSGSLHNHSNLQQMNLRRHRNDPSCRPSRACVYLVVCVCVCFCFFDYSRTDGLTEN